MRDKNEGAWEDWSSATCHRGGNVQLLLKIDRLLSAGALLAPFVLCKGHPNLLYVSPMNFSFNMNLGPRE